MRANAKKYLITSETREFLVVQKDGTGSIRGYCEGCDQDVELINLDSAVTVSGIGTLELISLLDAGTLHSLETTAGHLLVCAATLREQISGETI
jgi:hypothetical protein